MGGIGDVLNSVGNALTGGALGAVESAVGGIGKAITGGGGIGDIFGSLVDGFLPVAGNVVGGLFGGPAGAMLGGSVAKLLGSVVGGGQLPLPKLPGMDVGGLLNQAFGLIGGMGGPSGMPNVLGLLDKSLGLLGKMTELLGQGTSQVGQGLQAAGQGVQGLKLAPLAIDHAIAKIHGTKSSSSAGGTSGVGGDAGLADAASKAFGKMSSLEKKLENLDPDSDTYQQDLMKIQMQMQQIQQAISMITNIMKMKHDTAMSVISNLR